MAKPKQSLNTLCQIASQDMNEVFSVRADIVSERLDCI